MKCYALFLFLVVSATASLFAEPPLHPAPPPSTLPDVRLTFTEGDVVLKIDSTEGAPIDGDMPLMDGDEVRTSSASYAEVFFNDGTLVRIGPRSRVLLKRLLPGHIVLDLKAGVLLAKVQFDKSSGERFVVNTPVVMASVRGTEFVLEHLKGQTYAGVLDEGHLALKAPGFKKEVVMRFNQETIVARATPPRDPKVISRMYHYKNQMADMRSRIRALRKRLGPLTPEQCQLMRAGWINTRQSQSAAPAVPGATPKKSQSR